MITWIKGIYIRRLHKLAQKLDKKVGRRYSQGTAAGNLVNSNRTLKKKKKNEIQ